MSTQFLDETPGDTDVEEAIDENKLVLVKKRHRIDALRNAISDLRTQRPHMAGPTSSTAVPLAGSGLGLVGMGPGVGSTRRDVVYEAMEASRADGDDDVIATVASSMRLNEAPPTLSTACIEDAADTSLEMDGVLDASAPDATTINPNIAREDNDRRGCGSGDQIGKGVLL